MFVVKGLGRLAFVAIIALFLLTGYAHAQNSVALAPVLHPSFTDSTGKPLAAGELFFYAAGTSTLQATFADNLGTIQNPNPVLLDAGGVPSNASGAQIQIWLTNTSYRICGYSSALVQQFCWDNVSAYQILNGVQNIIFGGVTSDPSGLAGEAGYRSDIPCFRGYTTFWDCFVTLTGIQTVTNKTVDISANTLKNSTNTAGHYPRNNGTQYVDSAIQTQDVTATFVNEGITGTTTNFLVTLSGAPSTAIKPTLGTQQGIIGICTSGCGTTSSAQIQTSGIVSCAFDGATLAGAWVGISSSVAGECTQVSTTGIPANGNQTLGRVLSTNGGAGTYQILLFGAEIKLPLPPTVIAAANVTGLAANTSAAIYNSVTVNQFYRMSCYVVETQAATTSSTLPACNVIYTDNDSGISETIALTATDTTNLVGAVGRQPVTAIAGFFVKALSSIQYSTSGYTSVGGTPMQYAIHVRLEGPF